MIKPYEVALDLYGLKEISGPKHEPQVVQFFKDLGYDQINNDETAWCSAFVNWCHKVAGLPYTGKLHATSWLDWGEEVQDPERGDVVIFWRGSHKGEKIPGSDLIKGHVGFYIAERYGYIYTLSGNQKNQVNVLGYPKSKLLGYRRAKYPAQKQKIVS